MSLYDGAKRHLSPIEIARNRIAELERENAEVRKKNNELLDMLRPYPPEKYRLQLDFGDFHVRRVFHCTERQMIGRIATSMLVELERALASEKENERGCVQMAEGGPSV